MSIYAATVTEYIFTAIIVGLLIEIIISIYYPEFIRGIGIVIGMFLYIYVIPPEVWWSLFGKHAIPFGTSLVISAILWYTVYHIQHNINKKPIHPIGIAIVVLYYAYMMKIVMFPEKRYADDYRYAQKWWKENWDVNYTRN